jgi:hypothetical protein
MRSRFPSKVVDAHYVEAIEACFENQLFIVFMPRFLCLF